MDVLGAIAVDLGMTFLRLRPIHVRGPQRLLRLVHPVAETEASRPVANRAKAVSKVVRRASKVVRPVKRARARPPQMLLLLARRKGLPKARVRHWPLLMLRMQICAAD